MSGNYRDVAKHGEKISIYVDFVIDSSQPRFFVYDNSKRKGLASSKYTHGSGGSTAKKPLFSNRPGSECSSLGNYMLTENSKMKNGFDCIRMQGLSKTNSNVARRGIVIYTGAPLTSAEFIGMRIPLSRNLSQGCFGISTPTLRMLHKMVRNGEKIYLYAVDNAP